MIPQALSRALPWLACLVLFVAGQARATAEPVIEVAAFGVAPVLTAIGPRVAETRSTRIARGDEWAAVVRRLLPGNVDAGRLLAALAGANLPAPQPGRFVRQRGMANTWPLVVDYLQDGRTAFTLTIQRHDVEVVERLADDDLVRAASQDDVKNSLFAATDAVGLPEQIALQLVDIFSEEVDFLHDLGQGYRCAIVYEMNYQDGMPNPGRILAAELTHGGRKVSAFLHRFGNGDVGYFKPDGTDINRVLRPDGPTMGGHGAVVDASASFRRSPLEFSRITSAPAMLRFHPILKQWRAHRGIDYGAPIGTRVKATADGEVFFVGARGGYGNLVILHHYNRFTTFYGHLNGFARGIGAGTRVRKGDVIGYVGMTGLATGPHLHYELHDDLTPGRLHTPLVVRGIGADEAPAFHATMERLRAQLDYAYRANLVILD